MSPAKRRRQRNGKIKHAIWDEVAIEAAPCHYCGRLLRFREATIDHRVPRSQGGRTEIGNAVLACEACNRDKADLTEDEFRQQLADRAALAGGQPVVEFMGEIYT